MLKVANVSRKFQSGDGTVSAVDDVSFEVPEGKFVSIIGKSGSGKTTLLSLLGSSRIAARKSGSCSKPIT
jgi:putative ABC transport system ATP-binding protein